MAVVELAVGACSTGSKPTDRKADDSTRQNATEQSVDASAASSTEGNFLGLYTDPDDGSTLEISNGPDGTLSVVISIVRLTLLDDGRAEIADNALTFTATDASGNPIGGKITLDGDTATLTFTDSTRDYLPNGTTFSFTRTPSN